MGPKKWPAIHVDYDEELSPYGWSAHCGLGSHKFIIDQGGKYSEDQERVAAFGRR
jgi:hypothetical protein